VPIGTVEIEGVTGDRLPADRPEPETRRSPADANVARDAAYAVRTHKAERQQQNAFVRLTFTALSMRAKHRRGVSIRARHA
jgi:hypothetical protein